MSQRSESEDELKKILKNSFWKNQAGRSDFYFGEKARPDGFFVFFGARKILKKV
jgi:hypothetical protein